MNASSLFGFDAASLWSKSSGRKRKSGTSTGTNLPAEITTFLGQAEASYIRGDYNDAIQLLSEVTKKAPRLAEPYSILALIYEETGDQKHALQLYALAAAFSKRNLELWRKVLYLSMKMGEYQQATVALARCLSLSSLPDQEYSHIRIVLTAMLGQYRQLHALVNSHMTKNPDDMILLFKVVEMMIDMNYQQRAMKYASQYLSYWYINDHENRLSIQLTEDQAEDIIQNLSSITYVVRSLALIYIDMVRLVEAMKLLENTVLVFNVAFRNSSIQDEVFIFPHELSLLLGYLTFRLGAAKEDEATIDRGLQILQPSIAAVMGTPKALSDPVFGLHVVSNSLVEGSNPEEYEPLSLNTSDSSELLPSTSINTQELDTTSATLHILTLIAKKMADQNMKMRSCKIVDFVIDTWRLLVRKIPPVMFKTKYLFHLAKYLQVLQRHELALEIVEYCLRCNLFQGDALQFYAVEVMDHSPEKLSEITLLSSWYLRLVLNESKKIQSLIAGSRGSKMFGGDGEEEDEEEEEEEVGNELEEGNEMDVDKGDENSDEDVGATEVTRKNNGKSTKARDSSSRSKAKKPSTKKQLQRKRKTKNANSENDEDDEDLLADSSVYEDLSSNTVKGNKQPETLPASLPVQQESQSTTMDVDFALDEEDEDFTQDIDFFLMEQGQTTAVQPPHVSAGLITTTVSDLNPTKTNETASTMSTVSVPSSLLLLSESFLGMDDPVFQQSFPLTNITRQNSAASTSSGTSSSNAQKETSTQTAAANPLPPSSHTSADTSRVISDVAMHDKRLFMSFLSTTATRFDRESQELSPVSFVVKALGPRDEDQQEEQQPYHHYTVFSPWHARHSFHRHVLQDILQAICTYLFALAKQVKAAPSSAASLQDVDLIPVLGLALVQVYTRILSRRLKTRETIRMKAFMKQWQVYEQNVRDAASTCLWSELHRLSSKPVDSSQRLDTQQDSRWQEKFSLVALIYTLCDFLPLESVIDRDYLEELVPMFLPKFAALQASSTLPQELLLRQREVVRQQCSHIGHVEETLQHRRRHRAAWLSPSLVAVAAAAAASSTSTTLEHNNNAGLLDAHGSGAAGSGSLTSAVNNRRLSRNPLRRTLFSQESWLQTASMISKDVLQAAASLWEHPDDFQIANKLFRLLVDEAYGHSSADSTHLLERAFVSSEIYIENRLPIRTLLLELPEANAKSSVAHLLAGHDLALVRKHFEAVDAYLNAFLLSPNEPLIALTLSGYFMFLSTHPLFKTRYDNLLRAMTFLVHYQKLRRKQPIDVRTTSAYITEVTQYQETLYNLARLFQDLKLHHLAVANYRKVLQLFDDHLAKLAQQESDSGSRPIPINGVTREAAHNLVLLYRHNQSKDLALSVMLKYLRFE